MPVEPLALGTTDHGALVSFGKTYRITTPLGRLVADGGNVELGAVTADGVVRVEFQGACLDCPAQLATLRIAIEEPLRKAVPGVTAVVPG